MTRLMMEKQSHQSIDDACLVRATIYISTLLLVVVVVVVPRGPEAAGTRVLPQGPPGDLLTRSTHTLYDDDDDSRKKGGGGGKEDE